MAQIKAEVLHVCCTNRLAYPLTVACNPQDECHAYCDRKFGGHYECGTYCKHSAITHEFIERQYKRFEASEHNEWDCFLGCYDLNTTNAEYVCSYLEIDGHVYCDIRDEFKLYDPRIKHTGEGGESDS